jgi:pilus assembly protein CpaB
MSPTPFSVRFIVRHAKMNLNPRTLLFIGLALVCGLIGLLAVRNFLGTPAAPVAQKSKAPEGTTQVVVAATPLVMGQKIEPVLLRTVAWPTESLPAGTFSDVNALVASPNGQEGGRVTMRAIAAGEPILADRVSGPGGRMSLSGVLAEGMRAVTIRSNDIAGVGGFVLPGDRVDIEVTRSVTNGDSSAMVSNVIAQNLRVLGVDQVADEDAQKPVVVKAVTVEATTDESRRIMLAQQVGQVSLTLRNIADNAAGEWRTVTSLDLGAVPAYAFPPKARQAAAAAPAAPTINIQGPTAPAAAPAPAPAPRAAPAPAPVRAAAPAAPTLPRAPDGAEVRVTRGTDLTVYSVRDASTGQERSWLGVR